MFGVNTAYASSSGGVLENKRIDLDIRADELIGSKINSCIKNELMQLEHVAITSARPEISIKILARQITNSHNIELITLSAVVMKVFDNDAVIKHWASGFRQPFPYDAKIALQRLTKNLLIYQNQIIETGSSNEIEVMCKKLVDAINHPVY